ncbi:MAG: hypothetical protein ACIALR_03080 [Blastopirellula sp. JB062]
MKKAAIAISLLVFVAATAGCSVCQWLGKGIANQYYGAAERTDQWRDVTGQEDWQQSEFHQ